MLIEYLSRDQPAISLGLIIFKITNSAGCQDGCTGK